MAVIQLHRTFIRALISKPLEHAILHSHFLKNNSSNSIVEPAINSLAAEAVLNALHLAWSGRDISALLEFFTPDVVYRSDLRDDLGKARVYSSRAELEELLRFKVAIMISTTTVEQFAYMSGIARVRISFAQRHLKTGLQYEGTYRQIAMFRGSQIVLLEEFHDTHRLRAFWQLVGAEEQRG